MSEPITTPNPNPAPIVPEYKDKEIQCSDCTNIFIWNADEQKYYKDRNLFPPKRCPSCRLKRRQAASQGNLNITTGYENFPKEDRRGGNQ